MTKKLFSSSAGVRFAVLALAVALGGPATGQDISGGMPAVDGAVAGEIQTASQTAGSEAAPSVALVIDWSVSLDIAPFIGVLEFGYQGIVHDDSVLLLVRPGGLADEMDGVQPSALSIGLPAISIPESGSARWYGLVAGVDTNPGETFGNSILGDVTATIADWTSPSVDIDFSGLVDLDGGSELADMSWSGLSLAGDFFGEGEEGNRITGNLFGIQARGLAGLFARDGIVGGFGATREIAGTSDGDAILDGSDGDTVTIGGMPVDVDELEGAVGGFLPRPGEDFNIAEILGSIVNDGLGTEESSVVSAFRSTLLVTPLGGRQSRAVIRVLDQDPGLVEGRNEFGLNFIAATLDQSVHLQGRDENAADWQIQPGLEVEPVPGGVRLGVSIATGIAPSANPVSGSAHWTGIVLGREAAEDLMADADPLHGTAWISIDDLSDPSVDVLLSDLVNLRSGRELEDIAWTELPVRRGSFSSGEGDDSLSGRFYGFGHEEVAGTFRRDAVSGIFGASRSESAPRGGDDSGLEEPVTGLAPYAISTSLVGSVGELGLDQEFATSAVLGMLPVLGETIPCPEDAACEPSPDANFLQGFLTIGPTRPENAQRRYGIPTATIVRDAVLAGNPVEITVWGGWLENGSFGVARFSAAAVRRSPHRGVVAIATGMSWETNPVAGSGVWSGMMVGIDAAEGRREGRFLRGAAKISIADFANPSVDVTFRRIFDDDSQSYREDMAWTGIPVVAGGFSSTQDGDIIDGKFYGPAREEVGGTFERGGVVGAFGAQADPYGIP